MSDKGRHFRLKSGIEIVGKYSSTWDEAVRYDVPNQPPYWIPREWLEEFEPPRKAPEEYNSAEVDVDGHVWQLIWNCASKLSWSCTYGSVGNERFKNLSWETLQERHGPTKPVEL